MSDHVFAGEQFTAPTPTRGLVVVVDDPRSAHGSELAAYAAQVAPGLPLAWLVPGLDTPERLLDARGAAAVALPFSIRGAGRRDRYAVRLAEACSTLGEAGVPVFAATPRRLHAPHHAGEAPWSASRDCLRRALLHAGAGAANPVGVANV